MQQDYWGGTDMVYQCLIDKRRTEKFSSIIKKTIQRGDVVVDLGSGSGIMAMLALAAGAKTVYAVEIDKSLCSVLRKNIIINGFEDRIKVINKSAFDVIVPETVDVVVCEMIATGLIDEGQIPAMNNILKYTKPSAKIIPSKINNFVDVVWVNNMFYGHKINCIQYEYEWEKEFGKVTPYTEKYCYKTIDFNRQNNDKFVDCEINLECKADGAIDALRITSTSDFHDNSSFGGSAAYCMPMMLPIPETKVTRGQELKIKLRYEMCSGLNNVNYSVVAMEKENVKLNKSRILTTV